MGKYLLYTGIIFLVLGFISCIFVFFCFSIRACFSEWRFIERNEMGKAVRENLSVGKKRRKRETVLKSVNDNTGSYTLGTLETEGSEQRTAKRSPNVVVDTSIEHTESVYFGKDIIKASLTEVLDDDDDDVVLSDVVIGDETGVLIENEEPGDETGVLVDLEQPSEETGVLDISGILEEIGVLEDVNN